MSCATRELRGSCIVIFIGLFLTLAIGIVELSHVAACHPPGIFAHGFSKHLRWIFALLPVSGTIIYFLVCTTLPSEHLRLPRGYTLPVPSGELFLHGYALLLPSGERFFFPQGNFFCSPGEPFRFPQGCAYRAGTPCLFPRGTFPAGVHLACSPREPFLFPQGNFFCPGTPCLFPQGTIFFSPRVYVACSPRGTFFVPSGVCFPPVPLGEAFILPQGSFFRTGTPCLFP